MATRNIGSAMKSIYGTGGFNPRRFDHKPKKSGRSLYVWGLSLFLFALVAVVLGGMYLFGAAPSGFTGERVTIALAGEKNPQTAQNTSYTLTITNGEEVAIEDLELFADWPDSSGDAQSGIAHFISSDISAVSEANNTWNLGSLGPGESTDINVTLRFAGRAGSEVAMPFSLTFKPGTFTSTYTVSHRAMVTLGDPTISLDISGPAVAAEGAEVVFTVSVSGDSLASADLDKTALGLTVPAALSDARFTPAPASDAGAPSWPLSSLVKKGDSYELSVAAKVNAKSGEAAQLKAALNRPGLEEPLVAASHEMRVQNAAVSVSVSGSPAQGQKLQWGERIEYTITLENTGTYVMRNVVVRFQLPNESLWQADSIQVQDGGFYESGSAFWDASTTASLDSLRPEAQTTLSLNLLAGERPPRGFAGIPRLVAGAEVTANLGDQEVSVASEEHIINILSDIDFGIRGMHKSPEGALLGSGPHPPEPRQKTVYVIQWNIGPTTSGLRDLDLSVRLPSYVSWEDDASLTVGEIGFDSGSRTVTWRASRVPALDLPLEVRFKVSVSPEVGLDSSALIVERSEFKVVDDAASEAMELFLNGITIGSIE